eukprot:2810171-Lingulodinium_polyedra.AAC.1
MTIFQTAIAKSQQREAQLSQEAYEHRVQYDEEITQLHARLDASENSQLNDSNSWCDGRGGIGRGPLRPPR